jgi:HEAT repeat protein
MRRLREETPVEDWVRELTGRAGAVRRAPEDYKRVFTEVVRKLLDAEEWPGAQGSPKLLLDEIVLRAGAPGSEDKLRALRQVLVEQLGEHKDAGERIFLLRELAIVGREEAVPALEKLIDGAEPAIREYAIRALAANPSREAAEALLAAMRKAGEPARRAALVNSLAGRKEKEAMDAVRAALPDLPPAARALLGGALKDREGGASPAATR